MFNAPSLDDSRIGSTAGAAVALLLVGSIAAACTPQAGAADGAFAAVEQDLLTPLLLPVTPGNGVAAKVVCPNLSGGSCGSVLATVGDAVTSLNSLAPGATPPAAPQVFSWTQHQPIDWTDSTASTTGLFGTNLDFRGLFAATAVHQVAWSFAGYIAIPAAGTKSFAVGSDDGFQLSISNGSQVLTYTSSAPRSFAFGGTTAALTPPAPPNQPVLQVAFPSAGLYPFEIIYYEQTGQSGIEVAWADGAKIAVPTGAALNGFTLVPADSFYAPDIRASLYADNVTGAGTGADNVAVGTKLAYTASITNVGPVGATGLKYTVKVPSASLSGVTTSSPGCTVSGVATFTMTCASFSLAAGATVQVSFTGTVAAGFAPGLDVQGVVQGLATASEVAAATGDTAQIYVFTDDAAAGAPANTTETGNGPAAQVGNGRGLADDDPTHVTSGQPVSQPPAITAPASPVSSLTTTVVSGTSSFGAGAQVKVSFAGPGSPTCTATVAAGGAWSCPALALLDGSFTLTAALVNLAGISGTPSAPFALTVNPPPAPTLLSPAANSTQRSSPLFLAGTSTMPAGTNVRATATDAASVAHSCIATVQADGSWLCAVVLADGGYSWTAGAVEANGTVASAAPRNFTLNTAGLPAPTFDQTAPSPTQQQRPTLTGTVNAAEVGAGYRLEIREGNTILCSVNPVAGVTWSCTPGSNLADGVHLLTAVVVDTGNNASPASNADAFTVDTTAPGAPGLAAVPSPISSSHPTFSGSGEAGATVKVTDASNNLLCSALVSASGSWSCSSVPALPEGSNTVTAAQTDPAGNTGAGAQRTFTVDTLAPAAPAFPQPATPSQSATLALSGTAEVGSTVTVKDQTGRVVCSVGPLATTAWSCTSAALPDGSNTLSAAATDAAGNISAATSRTVAVDTISPTAPVLAQTQSPGSNTLPTFTGSAEANSTVKVSEGATLLCTAVATTGAFSCTSTVALTGAPQTHNATAKASDGAGNVSPASNVDSFVIDTTVPAAPGLNAPPANTASTQPTFGGTGTPGDVVTVKNGASVICTAVVLAGGSWSCTSAVVLSGSPATSYTVTAVQTSPAGVTSGASPGRTFIVDTHTPAAPTLAQPATPSKNPTPTLSGTAEAGSTVTVKDQTGRVICSVGPLAGTAWTCTAAALPDGSSALTASATDAAGVNGPASAPRSVVVDTVLPDAPALDQTASPTSVTMPVFSGTAEASSKVSVFEGATLLCTATATGGAFSCTSAVALTGAPQQHTAIAKATDAADNTSAASNADNFTVDTTQPAPPTLAAQAVPAGGQAGSTSNTQPVFSGTGTPGDLVSVSSSAPSAQVLCTALVHADGSWSCTSIPLSGAPATDYVFAAAQTSPAGVTSAATPSQTLTVDTHTPLTPTLAVPASPTNVGVPSFSGQAEPGDSLVVRDQTGRVVCTVAAVPASGDWSCSGALPDGTSTLTATAASPAGVASNPSAPATLLVDTIAPQAPALAQTASPTGGTLPGFSGVAEPGSTVEVSEGGVLLCSATAQANGAFQCTSLVQLTGAPQLHDVTAVATDAAQNTSPPSNLDAFVVDTTVPGAPTLDALATPPGGKPGTTAQQQPGFTGTGTPGDLLAVTASVPAVQLLCIALVQADGRWSCGSAVILTGAPATAYVVTAAQTSPANVGGPASAPIAFTVDTHVPGTPTLDQPASPSGSTPLLSGTAEEGSTLTVVDGTGRVVCTVSPVPTGGAWSCTSAALPDGSSTLTALATSAAGIDSPPSAPVSLVVDTLAPAAPALSQTASPSANTLPVFSGTAEPGSTVTVSESGTAICSAVASSTGAFACTAQLELTGAPQLHSVTATATDAAGNTSAPGNQDAFLIDTTVPSAALVDPLPTPPGGQPGTTGDTQPPISGTGTAGDVITVTTGGVVLCTAVVALDGTWHCTSDVTLPGDPPTGYPITVTQTSPAGVTGPATVITITVDSRNPAAPTLNAPVSPTADPRPVFSGAGEAGDALAVVDAYGHFVCSATVAPSGSWSCQPGLALPDGDYRLTALQTTPGGRSSGASPGVPLSIRTLTVPTLAQPRSPTQQHQPALSGTAQPGTNVLVLAGRDPVCTAAVDADGTWSCTPAAPLPDGLYRLQAQATDLQGHGSPVTAARTLVIDSTPGAAPILAQLVSPTIVQQPLLSGSAEAGSLVTVRSAGVADAADALVCTAVASGSGAFSCLPPLPLSAGEHTFTATATDEVGNVSDASAPVSVTVVAAPAAPAVFIDSPADGSEVMELQPLVRGHSAAGASVQVVFDGVPFSAQVEADGNWMFLPPTRLAWGAHTLTARATDSWQQQGAIASSSFTVMEGVVVRGGCASGGVPAPWLALALMLPLFFRRRRTVAAPVRSSSAATEQNARAARAAARRRSVGLRLVLLAGLPLAANAATPEIDLALFRPASGGDGYVAVSGARPLLSDEGRFELRFWADDAVQPLVAYTDKGTRNVLIRNRAGGVLGLNLHLFGPFSLGAQLPTTLSQSGDLSSLPLAVRGPTTLGSGIGDLRLMPRMALLRQEQVGLDLAAELSLELPTATNGTLAGETRVQGGALLAGGHRFWLPGASSLEVLGNAYARLRPTRQFVDVKTGNELGLLAALGYYPGKASKLIPHRVFAEVEGRSWVASGFAPGSAPSEWRVGGGFCLGRGFALDVAGGGALSNGIGTPKARFVMGFGFSPGACRDSDRDGDGIADRVDRCPNQPGVAAAGGCPLPADRDGDGIADADDRCPDTFGKREFQGCPNAPDRDGDGVADQDDQCPDVPGPASNHGCPLPAQVACPAPAKELALPEPLLPLPRPELVVAPPDRDHDGVPDAEDNCPDTPGPVDNHGCPKTVKQLVVIHGDKIEILDKVFFASSKAVIEPRSFKLLDQVASVLISHPELVLVEVQGHTDTIGVALRNTELSQRRAEAVLAHLAKKGVEAARLRAKGYGPDKPVAPNTTKANRDRNRRVEFQVIETRTRTVLVEVPAKS